MAAKPGKAHIKPGLLSWERMAWISTDSGLHLFAFFKIGLPLVS
jgi:hypothetical protein